MKPNITYDKYEWNLSATAVVGLAESHASISSLWVGMLTEPWYYASDLMSIDNWVLSQYIPRVSSPGIMFFNSRARILTIHLKRFP